MKLKLVVASMSVLGLVTCSAYAADATATAPVKHKHHHHHVVKKHHQEVANSDAVAQPVSYKDMGALPTCPIVDQYTTTLDVMGQNVGRAKPTEDCNKLISFAGGINFDAKWGNRSLGYQGENYQRLALNDAYLNVFGNVNEWTKAFASLSYGDPSDQSTNTFNTTSIGTYTHTGQYSNVYTNNSDNKITLEQGFIRFANFDQYPVFLQIGKQFQDFGRYTIHPVTRSTTQVLSETLQTSANLGFITAMGFHGSVYAFDNPLPERNGSGAVQGHNVTDYGVSLGYDLVNDQLGYGINVGWLYNMTGVNDVEGAVNQFRGTTTPPSTAQSTESSYKDRVSGLSIDGRVNSGPFSLIADYVTALQRFNAADLAVSASNPTQGAKPWAGNIQAGYTFVAMERNQNIYLGYQASGNALYVALPKSRWLVGWNTDVWKATNLGVEVGHDIDYGKGQGGTGDSNNTIGLRAAVKFG